MSDTESLEFFAESPSRSAIGSVGRGGGAESPTTAAFAMGSKGAAGAGGGSNNTSGGGGAAAAAPPSAAALGNVVNYSRGASPSPRNSVGGGVFQNINNNSFGASSAADSIQFVAMADDNNKSLVLSPTKTSSAPQPAAAVGGGGVLHRMPSLAASDASSMSIAFVEVSGGEGGGGGGGGGGAHNTSLGGNTNNSSTTHHHQQQQHDTSMTTAAAVAPRKSFVSNRMSAAGGGGVAKVAAITAKEHAQKARQLSAQATAKEILAQKQEQQEARLSQTLLAAEAKSHAAINPSLAAELKPRARKNFGGGGAAAAAANDGSDDTSSSEGAGKKNNAKMEQQAQRIASISPPKEVITEGVSTGSSPSSSVAGKNSNKNGGPANNAATTATAATAIFSSAVLPPSPSSPTGGKRMLSSPCKAPPTTRPPPKSPPYQQPRQQQDASPRGENSSAGSNQLISFMDFLKEEQHQMRKEENGGSGGEGAKGPKKTPPPPLSAAQRQQQQQQQGLSGSAADPSVSTTKVVLNPKGYVKKIITTKKMILKTIPKSVPAPASAAAPVPNTTAAAGPSPSLAVNRAGSEGSGGGVGSNSSASLLFIAEGLAKAAVPSAPVGGDGHQNLKSGDDVLTITSESQSVARRFVDRVGSSSQRALKAYAEDQQQLQEKQLAARRKSIGDDDDEDLNNSLAALAQQQKKKVSNAHDMANGGDLSRKDDDDDDADGHANNNNTNSLLHHRRDITPRIPRDRLIRDHLEDQATNNEQYTATASIMEELSHRHSSKLNKGRAGATPAAAPRGAGDSNNQNAATANDDTTASPPSRRKQQGGGGGGDVGTFTQKPPRPSRHVGGGADDDGGGANTSDTSYESDGEGGGEIGVHQTTANAAKMDGNAAAATRPHHIHHGSGQHALLSKKGSDVANGGNSEERPTMMVSASDVSPASELALKATNPWRGGDGGGRSAADGERPPLSVTAAVGGDRPTQHRTLSPEAAALMRQQQELTAKVASFNSNQQADLLALMRRVNKTKAKLFGGGGGVVGDSVDIVKDDPTIKTAVATVPSSYVGVREKQLAMSSGEESGPENAARRQRSSKQKTKASRIGDDIDDGAERKARAAANDKSKDNEALRGYHTVEAYRMMGAPLPSSSGAPPPSSLATAPQLYRDVVPHTYDSQYKRELGAPPLTDVAATTRRRDQHTATSGTAQQSAARRTLSPTSFSAALLANAARLRNGAPAWDYDYAHQQQQNNDGNQNQNARRRTHSEANNKQPQSMAVVAKPTRLGGAAAAPSGGRRTQSAGCGVRGNSGAYLDTSPPQHHLPPNHRRFGDVINYDPSHHARNATTVADAVDTYNRLQSPLQFESSKSKGTSHQQHHQYHRASQPAATDRSKEQHERPRFVEDDDAYDSEEEEEDARRQQQQQRRRQYEREVLAKDLPFGAPAHTGNKHGGGRANILGPSANSRRAVIGSDSDSDDDDEHYHQYGAANIIGGDGAAKVSSSSVSQQRRTPSSYSNQHRRANAHYAEVERRERNINEKKKDGAKSKQKTRGGKDDSESEEDDDYDYDAANRGIPHHGYLISDGFTVIDHENGDDEEDDDNEDDFNDAEAGRTKKMAAKKKPNPFTVRRPPPMPISPLRAAALRVASKAFGVRVWSIDEQIDEMVERHVAKLKAERSKKKKKQEGEAKESANAADDDVTTSESGGRATKVSIPADIRPIYFFSTGGTRLTNAQSMQFEAQLRTIENAMRQLLSSSVPAAADSTLQQEKEKKKKTKGTEFNATDIATIESSVLAMLMHGAPVPEGVSFAVTTSNDAQGAAPTSSSPAMSSSVSSSSYCHYFDPMMTSSTSCESGGLRSRPFVGDEKDNWGLKKIRPHAAGDKENLAPPSTSTTKKKASRSQSSLSSPNHVTMRRTQVLRNVFSLLLALYDSESDISAAMATTAGGEASSASCVSAALVASRDVMQLKPRGRSKSQSPTGTNSETLKKTSSNNIATSTNKNTTDAVLEEIEALFASTPRVPATASTTGRWLSSQQLAACIPFLLAEAEAKASNNVVGHTHVPRKSRGGSTMTAATTTTSVLFDRNSNAAPSPSSMSAAADLFHASPRPARPQTHPSSSAGGRVSQTTPTATAAPLPDAMMPVSVPLPLHINTIKALSPNKAGAASTTSKTVAGGKASDNNSLYAPFGCRSHAQFRLLCDFAGGVLLPILVGDGGNDGNGGGHGGSHKYACYQKWDFPTFSRVLLNSEELGLHTAANNQHHAHHDHQQKKGNNGGGCASSAAVASLYDEYFTALSPGFEKKL